MTFARLILLTQVVICVMATIAVADTPNAIGIYHPLPANTGDLSDKTNYLGAPGTFQAYAVLTEPWNENTGNSIANLGGFEFRINLPGNVLLMGASLPASCTNFMSPPEFFVGSNLPVVGGMCTLITLDLGEFTGQRSAIYLSPVSGVPSIPGAIAVADADDEFSISAAVPSSGSFDEPVFDLYFRPEVKDATWGEVKSLYR